MKTLYIVEYNELDTSYPVGAFDSEEKANNYISRQPNGEHSEIHHYEVVECFYYEDYE